MPAGTLTLTNNSTIIKGTGTAFNTELKAGDFIVSVVGGVTYTLPIKNVDSATQATLIKAYDGPTQAGAAWYAVPRDAMNTITAQLAAETAKALRGLNLDKNNWQQVFSGTGNITVTLPDGSTFTGPAWNSFTTALDQKAEKKSVDDLSAVVEKKADANNVIKPGDNGLGDKWNGYIESNTNSIDTLRQQIGEKGFSVFRNNGDISAPWLVNRYAPGFWMRTLDTFALVSISHDQPSLTVSTGSISRGWVQNYSLWNTRNTTVDSNGFIKKASPIVKLFRDGSCELNDESQGVTTERLSEGVYRVSGTLGFNADAQWGGPDGGIEVPLDRNKQPLVWVDYEVEPTGDLLLKTYHRTHPAAPPFARNDVLGYDEGMPIDIPTDRWVDLRVEMPINMEKNQ